MFLSFGSRGGRFVNDVDDCTCRTQSDLWHVQTPASVHAASASLILQISIVVEPSKLPLQIRHTTMKVVLVLATCGMLFTTTLSWSIAFYTGEDCNGDETFNNAIHTGSGSSACIAAGAPTADVECSWYSNGGQSEENCTAAMNPQPKSLKFAQTGSCAVSWYGCESPNWVSCEWCCVYVDSG